MNILIIVSSLRIGGAEKQAVNDANILCVRNDTHLMVFNDGMLKVKLSPKVKYSVIEKPGYIAKSKLIANYIVEHKIQVIHASLFAPMVTSVLTSLRTKTPVFWSFHSHIFDMPLKSKLAILLLARHKRLKKIFYVNHELMLFFEKRLILPSRKSEVLYNTTEFEYSNNTKKRGQLIYIGYVGRLVELKRVHILLELGQYLKENKIFNFSIEIYGDGDTRKELERLSAKYELQDFIVFHGFKTDLRAAYQSFDLFVNPSREECLSIATIDAGIMGKPMIVFDVGGNDEIVQHNKSGFVVKSKEELFLATKELILDEDKRLEFGESAIKHCESNFTEKIRKKKLTQYFYDASKS